MGIGQIALTGWVGSGIILQNRIEVSLELLAEAACTVAVYLDGAVEIEWGFYKD